MIAAALGACAGDDEEVSVEATGPQLFDDTPTDLGVPPVPSVSPTVAPTLTPSLTPTMVPTTVANRAAYRLKNRGADTFIRPANCAMDEGANLVITSQNQPAQDSCAVFEFIPEASQSDAFYIKNTASKHFIAPQACASAGDDTVAISQINSNADLSCALWSVDEIPDTPGYFRIRNIANDSFIRSYQCDAQQDDTVEIRQVANTYTGDCTMWSLEDVTSEFSELMDSLAIEGVNLDTPVIPTLIPTTAPPPMPTNQPSTGPSPVPTPVNACVDVAKDFAPVVAVINQNCAGCHVGENSFGGDFLISGSGDADDLIAFIKTVKSVNNFDQSLLLTKPLGGDGHGGGKIFENTDADYLKLYAYVDALNTCEGPLPSAAPSSVPTSPASPTPTDVPTPTQVPTPSVSPTSIPTQTPTVVPTVTPTQVPSPSPRPTRFCDDVEEEFLLTAYPVLEAECKNCHVGPNASSGSLNLTNGGNRSDFNVFKTIASELVDGESKLLLKPLNEIPHGPGQRLTRGSAEFTVLQDYVTDLLACEVRAVPSPTPEPQKELGLRYPSAYSQLHKTTMMLASRLPSDAEINNLEAASNDSQRTQRLGAVIDQLMTEQYFYDGLKHSFNDLLLTDWRAWSTAPAANMFFGLLNGSFDRESDAAQQRGERTGAYGIARAPLELIEYVVKNDRPFTEILTANYLMVNPYSARVFGADVGDAAFLNSEDGDDFRPTYRITDLEGRNYNFAGILSTGAFLDRYPTTFTNRNRARAKYVFDYFLDFDVEASFDRDTLDLDNVVGHVPTYEDAQCTSCHDLIDPIAGLFKNWTARGRFIPSNNWFNKRNTQNVPQMLPPGFVPLLDSGNARDNAISIPEAEATNSISWLAQKIANDPRFATKMTKHTFEWLTGINPNNSAVIGFIREQASAFIDSGYDYKSLVKAIMLSDYARATNIGADEDPSNFSVFGERRTLTPEKMRLKIAAVSGRDWISPNTNRVLDSIDYRLMYGGIDSDGVTVRQTERNRLMAALQERIAQQVSCEITADQLRGSRGLFEGINDTDYPGDGKGGVNKTKQHIQSLARKILGMDYAMDSVEITAAYNLFNDVRALSSTTVMAGCRGEGAAEDPNKVITPWMSVLSYFMMDEMFFYH